MKEKAIQKNKRMVNSQTKQSMGSFRSVNKRRLIKRKNKKKDISKLKLKTPKEKYNELIVGSQNIHLLNEKDLTSSISEELTDLAKYLELIVCPICYHNYDTQTRKPMIVCKSDKHVICLSCVNIQKGFNLGEKCCFCRHILDYENAKCHQQIFDWLRLSKYLDIKLPTKLSQLPEEMHASFRKLSMHQYYQDLTNQSQARLRSLLRQAKGREAYCDSLSKEIQQKKDQVRILNKKIKEFQKDYLFYSQRDEREKQHLRTVLQAFGGEQEKVLLMINQARSSIKQHFQIIQKKHNEAVTLFMSKLTPAHIRKHPEIRSNVRSLENSFYSAFDERKIMTVINRPNLNTCCSHCTKLFNLIHFKMKNLQKERLAQIAKLTSTIKKSIYWVVKSLLLFIPIHYDELQLRREVMMGYQECCSMEDEVVSEERELPQSDQSNESQFSIQMPEQSPSYS